MNEACRVQASTLEGMIFPLRFLVGLCDRGAGRAALGSPPLGIPRRGLLARRIYRQCGSHNLNYTALPRSCLSGRSCSCRTALPRAVQGLLRPRASRPQHSWVQPSSLLEAELRVQELELVSGEELLHGVSPRPRPPAFL